MTVSSPEGSQVGYLTGASRKHSDRRARFEDGASTMDPSPFEPKTEAQSLTMYAGNLDFLELIKAIFWALFSSHRQYLSPTLLAGYKGTVDTS